ncbi:MAG: hypothetical protein AAGH48_06975 [Pseudomonadota bacterium]
MAWQWAVAITLAIGFAAGRLVGFEVWAARRWARRRGRRAEKHPPIGGA